MYKEKPFLPRLSIIPLKCRAWFSENFQGFPGVKSGKPGIDKF
jgi:hypothetical protein